MKHYLKPSQRNKSRKNLTPEARKTWFGNYYENGRVHSFSLKTTNKRIAEEWFAKMQAQRFAPETPQVGKASLKEASEKFLAEVENVRRRSLGTAKLYRRILSLLIKRFRENAEMADLTPQTCADFVAATFANYSAHTAKHRLALYRSFWNWAADRYNLPGKNPFKGIMVQKPKFTPRKFWTVEECEKIIAAADGDEMKCYFALMAFAGLRREEARLLRFDNIADGYISLIGKGGKFAKIPISSRLKEHLNQYLTLKGWNSNNTGPLFPTLAKPPRIQEYHIEKAVALAGLPDGDSHFHRFRHSFASNLLRQGRSIKAVQILMRHENVTITLNIYGHLLPSDLEQAVEL